MISEINESKILAKHISCECKCKLDGTKCKSNQWWKNDNVSVKNTIYVKRNLFGILVHVSVKIENI